MKKILLALLLLPIFASAQQVPVAHKDSLNNWVIDYNVAELANEALEKVGCDSIRFDGYNLVWENSTDVVIMLYGTSLNGLDVVDRMVVALRGADTLETVYDLYGAAGGVCSKMACCSVCGKLKNGNCGCATESCTGGICDTRWYANYPVNGLSNEIRQNLL